MTDKGAHDVGIDDELKKNVAAVLKGLDRARKAGAALTKMKEPGIVEARATLGEALDALRAIDVTSLVRDLQRRHDDAVRREELALDHRRESLRRAAEAAGWSFRRMQVHDLVGCFRIDYKGVRVSLQLGSEVADQFDEVDGARLFERVNALRERLESVPLSRSRFLLTMKHAQLLARAHGIDRDGRVGIRRLYPLVVLARQALDEKFVNRPAARSFTEYSLAQFAFDLARFTREGVVEGGERLRNQPPNMASIEKKATMTLPSLDGSGSGEQLGLVWVEKVDKA